MRLCAWIAFLVVINFPAWAAPKLRLCVDHYPPFQIIEDEQVTGENVVAARLFAQLIDHELVIEQSPNFARCLRMLETGNVDMVAGLIQQPQRMTYAHFLPFRLDSAYRFISDLTVADIHQYQALRQHTIGVSRDTFYFERFDQDKQLRKVVVNSIDIAMNMLLKGRFDLLIAPEITLASLQRRFPQFVERLKVHPYQFQEQRLIYFGVSRKHKLSISDIQLQRTIEQAYREQEFQKEIERFIESNVDWY
ncbi:ABC transporter substrate-binding protein [Shewanella sp. Scap07]|uniref:substrate-binding periplasmic protein n=1 Tax=Shewanella sp. Scap07 TaxID=2589987 RepID=UPI0015C0C48B|nr:transporter substrate-binding domain-containing protein [Shewanella sp. Scap07]